MFNIGHAGAPPKFTVAGLIGRNKSGEVTEVAFGVVRALDYLSIALMLGGLAFLLRRPGCPRCRALADGAEPRLAGGLAGVRAAPAAAARRRGRARHRWSSVLGILLQGASAAGRLAVGLAEEHRSSTTPCKAASARCGAARAIDWLVIGALVGSREALGREVVPTLTRGRRSPVLATRARRG